MAADLYAERDLVELGADYTKHLDAMTREGLHAKSDIAAELAWRDRLIAALRAEAGAVDYPAEFVRTMQQAVENVTVPKMSPLKQELFKAGCVATINAINAALAQARRTDRE